jgi:hypothetical protein
MDKISEEYFTYFSHCIHGHKILMISASRPEGAPPWAQGAHYQRLGLETLSLDVSIRLVRNILGGLPLAPEIEKKIVEKTGGNPFFVEEIVRDLLDRGDLVKSGDRYICNRPIYQLEIPNTIQGVLAARMDRLSEDLKQTMQVASVIGRDFAFRLLKSIMELGEELRVRLTNLVGLEILYEKALYPELEYIFKMFLPRRWLTRVCSNRGARRSTAALPGPSKSCMLIGFPNTTSCLPIITGEVERQRRPLSI